MTLQKIVEKFGDLLSSNNLKITAAESCTGGGIAQTITSIPGSSTWFDMGFVTYSNDAKCKLLGVDPAIIESYGAVSEETVLQMARGALAVSGADVAIATSGIAGPGGGSLEKPVGTVWFAWAFKGGTHSEKVIFTGDRNAIQIQAIIHALENGYRKTLDYCT